jgi:GT2 family glycosyltransferase
LDPFIFSLYARYEAAKYLELKCGAMENRIGGGCESRYRKHRVEWSFDVLDKNACILGKWLASQGLQHASKGLLMVDLMVPTLGAPQKNLCNIIDLALQGARVESCAHVSGVAVGVVVVIDDPTQIGSYSKLWKRYGSNAKVRIRKNESNLGASGTRNRCMAESSAQWLVFVDDDVVPDKTIVQAYVDAIVNYGSRAGGFVGDTRFPSPCTPRQAAVHVSGITFFWGIASYMHSVVQAGPEPQEVHWGPTANLCTRRIRNVTFSCEYRRRGGGEDIAYCNAMSAACGLPLLTAPHATATHPYWNAGAVALSRFWGWAVGDSRLLFEFPELTYTAAPNVVEIVFFALCLSFIMAVVAGAFFGYQTAFGVGKVGLSFAFGASMANALLVALDVIRRCREEDAGDIDLKRACMGRNSKIAYTLQVALQTALILHANQAGRMWSLLQQKQVRCLQKRYMWWGPTRQDIVHEEKARARKYLQHLLACGCVCAATAMIILT